VIDPVHHAGSDRYQDPRIGHLGHVLCQSRRSRIMNVLDRRLRKEPCADPGPAEGVRNTVGPSRDIDGITGGSWSRSVHSDRSASRGSSLEARRAAGTAAIKAVSSSNPTGNAMLNASVGCTS